jgi:bifunctional enzyme CysN/CysC
VDRVGGNTLGAGLIEYALRRNQSVFWQKFELNQEAQAAQKNQKPCVLWFTGLSASGKSTVAGLAAKRLHNSGRHVYILDGDNLRHGLCRDLGFTEADRAENIRRASEVAKLMADAGLIVLASFISPYREDRAAIRDRFQPGEFFEVFMDTPLSVCIKRDPKGLYAKALDGKLPNFTGLTAPFEPPETPDLHLDGQKEADELVQQVLDFLEAQK